MEVIDIMNGIFLFLIFLLIALFILFIIDISTEKLIGYRTVKCYDRYSNEIEGLTCEEEVRCGSISKDLFGLKYCEIAPKEKQNE